MKSRILVALLIAMSNIQAQTFEWAKSMGSSNSDYAQAITTDASGNVYTTGSFMGNVDFDPGAGTTNLNSVGSIGTSDIFIQKLDASGNFLWVKSMGGISSESGNSIFVDLAGNVYTTGWFSGTVDFDPGAGNMNLTSVSNSVDFFIQKLDASGNFVWAKSVGGPSADYSYSIAVDVSGNVYTTGWITGIVDLDPGVGTAYYTSISGSDDVFVLKLDPAGNFLWAKTMGGGAEDRGYSIRLDDFGNIYTTGHFRNTADFDPGAGIFNLISVGLGDIYVHKMDASGNLLWAKSIGSSSHDGGQGIDVDDLGNVYITGRFQGTVDFDPGAGTNNYTSAGISDFFILKLNASGDFLWATATGGSSSEEGKSISVDASGNVYATGYFYGLVDFDPGAGTMNLSSAGVRDIFVQKLDASGTFLWANSTGGASFDEGNSIHIDASNNIYLAGYFQENVDFNPSAAISNLNSNSGSIDLFIRKMSQCANTSGTDTQIACGSYTWSNGVTYTTSNNTAFQTLINAAGCDSVLTLNLTINNVNSATTTFGNTITATETGASYQWVDCNNANSPINGANAQSFTPTSNGSYAVIVTKNGCSETSNCVVISTIGMDELEGFEVSIYPNPSSNVITISSATPFSNLELVNALGQSVHVEKFTETLEYSLTLPKEVGIYILKIYFNKGLVIQRISKR